MYLRIVPEASQRSPAVQQGGVINFIEAVKVNVCLVFRQLRHIYGPNIETAEQQFRSLKRHGKRFIGTNSEM